MPLQSKVNRYLAQGVPGAKATPDQSVYTPLNPLAAKALPVGGFVFPVVSGGVTDNTSATNVAGTATEVLGFVERVINYVNYDLLDDGTLTVPEGSALTVAVRGDYWAVSSTAATVGQKVLASTADGSISTGTPDATHLDTGWVVKTPGAIGEPIIISNWTSLAASASGGGSDTSNLMNKDFSNVSGTLPVANGGTGATTAEQARTNLGAAAAGA